MEDILRAEGITKTYIRGDVQESVLNGISFSLRASEFVAITGPSGSGKSTLLNIMGLMDFPSEGLLLLSGRDISKLGEADLDSIRRHELGFIFQTFNLMGALTTYENVELALLGHLMSKTEISDRVRSALEEVGMLEHSSKFPNQLSGGQRQRVAVARAFVHSPKIIVADEPTASLDRKNSDNLIRILNKLQSTHRTAVLMASHDEAVYGQASRILKVEEGILVEESQSEISVVSSRP